MARAISTAAAGGMNRRLLFLALIMAGLSAVLVYTAISRSDSEGGDISAAAVPAVVAKMAIPAGTRITAEMLEVRQVPQAGAPAGLFSTLDAAVDSVARYPIAVGEQLLLSKVVGGAEVVSNDVLSHILEDGTRALAIHASKVFGGGGLVLPGDHVDVLWVPTEVLEDHEGAMLLVENVEVLAVAQTLVDLVGAAPGVSEEGEGPASTAAGDERVRATDAELIPEASTVTLMVTPEQARLVFCAEQSGSLRLAVRPFGDTSPSGVPPATCVLVAEDEA